MPDTNRVEIVWRTVAIVASIAGIAAIPFFRDLVDDDRVALWLTCAVPFAIGLAAMAVPMDIRTRILLLWLAALVAIPVAMIIFWSGLGIIAVAVILAYLAAAWGLNEAGTAVR